MPIFFYKTNRFETIGDSNRFESRIRMLYNLVAVDAWWKRYLMSTNGN